MKNFPNETSHDNFLEALGEGGGGGGERNPFLVSTSSPSSSPPSSPSSSTALSSFTSESLSCSPFYLLSSSPCTSTPLSCSPSVLLSLLPSPPVRFSSKRPVWAQQLWFHMRRILTPLPCILTLSLISFIYYLVFTLATDLLERMESWDGNLTPTLSSTPNPGDLETQTWALRVFTQGFLAFGHLILGMLLWSYLRAVFTPEIRWVNEQREGERRRRRRREKRTIEVTYHLVPILTHLHLGAR
jgi:hypothetical protein